MKKLYASLTSSILVALSCMALAWLSGYNFNYRSPDVASGFALSAALTALCFGVVYLYPNWPDKKK